MRSPPFAKRCPVFGRQIRGFDRHDAVLDRHREPYRRRPCASRATPTSLQSLNVRGLYPGGEGAGYAGGILSAGVDGIKLAEAVAASYRNPRSSRRASA
jgi:uncharacterized FAD-dependent dehydrogenase